MNKIIGGKINQLSPDVRSPSLRMERNQSFLAPVPEITGTP